MILYERIDLTNYAKEEKSSPQRLSRALTWFSELSKSQTFDPNQDIRKKAQILFGKEWFEYHLQNNNILEGNDSINQMLLIPRPLHTLDMSDSDSKNGLIAVHGSNLDRTDFRDFDSVDRIGIAIYGNIPVKQYEISNLRFKEELRIKRKKVIKSLLEHIAEQYK